MAANDFNKRTVIVEIKYINSNNISIHTENCKLEIPLNISAECLSKSICRMAGIGDSSKKRGFADYAIEVFYVDLIDQGQTRKAPFVLRTDEQMAMFAKSDCKSLSVRVIQRIVSFEKGTLNILLQKDESSKSQADAGTSQSSTTSTTSTKTIDLQKGKKSQGDQRSSEIERLKQLLLKTNNARLSEDRKCIMCLLCGKSPKMDKSRKRSAEGHIKYFNRVHSCTKSTKSAKPDTRIEEFFGPAVKRKKENSKDDAEPIGAVAHPDHPDSPIDNDE